MPVGEHLKKENRVNGKVVKDPERERLLAMAQELGIDHHKQETKRLAKRVIHQATLSPLRIAGTRGTGSSWNWPKVMDIVIDRVMEEPLGGLRGAVKEPWVDPDTGESWPLPTERAFYDYNGRPPEVEFMVAEMRRMQSEAMGDAVMEKIMNVEEWQYDEKEGRDGQVIHTARQNTAGISKVKLMAEQAKYLSASWNERYVQKQRSEVEVRDPQLKDIIQQGLPSLEDMKK